MTRNKLLYFFFTHFASLQIVIFLLHWNTYLIITSTRKRTKMRKLTCIFYERNIAWYTMWELEKYFKKISRTTAGERTNSC